MSLGRDFRLREVGGRGGSSPALLEDEMARSWLRLELTSSLVRAASCSSDARCSRSSITFSFSRYSFSVQHPCQQFFQSQTKNWKQNASIFMQGWKQMHRLR